MPVRIIITGENLSFEQVISYQKAGQIIAFLGDPEVPEEKEDLLGKRMRSQTVPVSPHDILSQTNAITNPQKITVLGNYLSENTDGNAFKADELYVLLKKMGVAPANFSRDLKTAVSYQYIAALQEKEGKYTVTDKGKMAMKNRFIDPPQQTQNMHTRGGFKKSVPPREEVVSLPLTTELEGYPGFHDVPTKAAAILWLLAYAAARGIPSLSPREVAFLSEKLRRKISQNDFSAHNKRNFTQGYVSASEGRYTLLSKGYAYLKRSDSSSRNNR